MANRFLTTKEIVSEIALPYLKKVRADLIAHPLAHGEERLYPNPLGADMMPLKFVGGEDFEKWLSSLDGRSIMKTYCVKCDLEYDDAKCTTICPHEQFISDDHAAQKDLAFSLIDKDLWFAHIQTGTPFRVQSINHEGMIELQGMSGYFAPSLFVVKL
jgi:hypothetical protein